MISNPYTDQNQLYIALGYCGLMLFIAWLLKKYPPKKINHLYGYRTATSMKSQESWVFAQQYSAKKMMTMGACITALGLLSWIIDLQLLWSVGIALSIVTIVPLLMLFKVESELKKRFPKK